MANPAPSGFGVAPGHGCFHGLLKSGDFVFLDPCDALCAEALCDGIDENGQPIYSDGYHLSKCGSRRVIRAFLPQLRAVLEARDRDP